MAPKQTGAPLPGPSLGAIRAEVRARIASMAATQPAPRPAPRELAIPGRLYTRLVHPMASLGSYVRSPNIASSSGCLAAPSRPALPTSTPCSAGGRKDAPAINYTARGDQKRGLQVAADAEVLDAAMTKFSRDVKSSGDTSELYWKLWVDVHEAVYWPRLGEEAPFPVIPLTPLKMKQSGALS